MAVLWCRGRLAVYSVPVILRPLQPGVSEPTADRLAEGDADEADPVWEEPEPDRYADRCSNGERMEPAGAAQRRPLHPERHHRHQGRTFPIAIGSPDSGQELDQEQGDQE